MSEPAWEIAKLFPLQGAWTEDDYLDFSGRHRGVEFVDGVIEVLPVPTRTHQRILKLLLWLLDAYASRAGGTVGFAGTRLKLPGNRYREPDLLFATKDNLGFEGEEYWTGADLVAEIVSGGAGDRERDLVTKRGEYARGGVREYWVVDPEAATVRVLVLRDGGYVEHGTFKAGERATSPTFDGLSVDVADVFGA